MKYFIARAKQAIDLNKNGKVDLWEVAVLFAITLAIAVLVEVILG